jgi:hypothetical protein
MGGTLPMSEAGRLTAEDRLDIMDLLARYARCLDSGDLDGYVDNFAPDGVFDGTYGLSTGHAEIRAYIGQVIAEGRGGPLPNGDVAYRHFVGNPVIDGAGDHATVHSYMNLVNMGTDPPISATAEYNDSVVKLNGRWVFQTRASKWLAGKQPSKDPIK